MTNICLLNTSFPVSLSIFILFNFNHFVNRFIEIFGNKNFLRTINYLELQAKMGALRYLDYPYFRSTIFDCMSLLGEEDDGDK